MDTNIRVRRTLEHIRRRLSRFFVAGLSCVTSEDTGKIIGSIDKLELDGEENERLNDVKEFLQVFTRTDNVHHRFKLATKMVLALDQLALRRLDSPRLVSSNHTQLMDSPSIELTEENIPKTPEAIACLAQSGHGIIELIHYIRSGLLKKETVIVQDLIPLLSHSSLRKETTAFLEGIEPEILIPVASELLSMKNKLLSLSGAELLMNINTPNSINELMSFPDTPPMLALITKETRENPSKYARSIYDAIEKERNPVHKRSLATLMRHVKPSPEDIAMIKEMEKSADTITASYATIALMAAGAGNEQTLRTNISNLDNDILRVYSKIYLLRKKIIDGKHIVAEFNGDNEKLQKLLLEALEDLSPSEMIEILGPIINDALYGTSPSIRKKSLKKLIPGRCDSLVKKVFSVAANDKDPSLASMARNRLVELKGFDALALFYDTSQAIFIAPENLSLEALHYINYYVLPLIPHTGDCRFIRFLNYLFVKHSGKKQQFDYENSIKPILVQFGEPLVSVLSENLFASDNEMSLAAEELLIEIGGTQAQKARLCFSQGAPPVDMAFRQLGNARTCENAKEVIIKEGPDTVPRLLELLGDPRYREECLSILSHFADPRSFAPMLKLLGNPSTDLLVSGDISVMMRDTGFSERPITKHLVTIGDPIVESLIEKLHDPNWTVRYHAALILGEIGNSRAVPELIRLLHREETSLEVVGAIIKSFGNMETTEAVTILIPYLADPSRELRGETYRALGRIGTSDAINSLKETLATCRHLNEKKEIQRAIDEAESLKK